MPFNIEHVSELAHPETQVKRAEKIWRHLNANPELYDQNNYGICIPIRGTSCNTPICIFGWLRQLFPEDMISTVKELSFFRNDEDAEYAITHGDYSDSFFSNFYMAPRISKMLLPYGVSDLVNMPEYDAAPKLSELFFSMFPHIPLHDTFKELVNEGRDMKGLSPIVNWPKTSE